MKKQNKMYRHIAKEFLQPLVYIWSMIEPGKQNSAWDAETCFEMTLEAEFVAFSPHPAHIVCQLCNKNSCWFKSSRWKGCKMLLLTQVTLDTASNINQVEAVIASSHLTLNEIHWIDWYRFPYSKVIFFFTKINSSWNWKGAFRISCLKFFSEQEMRNKMGVCWVLVGTLS